jgi:hypothetical protein
MLLKLIKIYFFFNWYSLIQASNQAIDIHVQYQILIFRD